MRFALRVMLLVSVLCGFGLAGPYDAWTEPGVEVTFTGTGLESGHVLDLSVRNRSNHEVAFQLPQLTVLDSTMFAPVVVESKGGWKIPPGAEISHRVIGYSLEQSKPGPRRGQRAVYLPSEKPSFAPAQLALKKSLDFQRSPGFHSTVLSKEKHKILVTQRLIWTVYGPRNPKTPKALEQDLASSFQRAGESVNTATVQALTASVWQDVARVYNTLK
jgi:hypothetical protein